MAQSATKQNPKLVERELANGKISLSLEYYIGREYTAKTDESGKILIYSTGKMAGQPIYAVHHERKKEALGLYLFAKPRTPEERQHNKDTRLLAEKIRFEKEQDFLQDRKGYSLTINRDTDFITFYEDYISTYTKKDRRNIKQSLGRFKAYLKESRPSSVHSYTRDGEVITTYTLSAGALDKRLIKGFADYLEAHSTGDGAHTSFARFKKVCKAAFEAGYLKTNPAAEVSVKRPQNKLTKEVLTAEEIIALLHTHYKGENPTIERAFIFSLFTGLRFCDVRELRYSNIRPNKAGTMCVIFNQLKTGRTAEIPLRADLLQMISRPGGATAEDKIFDLPSHTMCLKALRVWTAKAGIAKHITWHCARHSFATNLLTNGANIKVVAELLGHSGLEQVNVYVKALEDSKQDAVNSLPSLSI